MDRHATADVLELEPTSPASLASADYSSQDGPSETLAKAPERSAPTMLEDNAGARAGTDG